MLPEKIEAECADRAKQVSSFIVMDILEKAHEMEACGEDIIHLEIGEPDFDTPQPVKEAALLVGDVCSLVPAVVKAGLEEKRLNDG